MIGLTTRAPWFLLSLAVLALPIVVSAEGVYKPEGEATTPAAPKPKPKPKPVVKKTAPAIPAAPIPYTTYSLTPDVAKALTPTVTPSPAATPVVVTDPPIVIAPSPILPVQPVETAPPPPPPPAVTPSAVTEISLRCETHKVRGKKTVASGTFYIDIFPSPVFPDEHADFKFLFADPAYDSLIRGTMCLDTTCSAEVSGTAYYLVNRVTKKGAALRITLDRARGAFYAEEMGKHGDDHFGEQGYCVPQPLPQALF